MNKTIASISAAVIVGTSSLSAYLPVPAELGVTSDLTFASEYNFRGYEVADNSFQPSLEASFGDFYLGIFANLAVDNRNRSNQRVDNELQYYGGFEIAAPQFEIGRASCREREQIAARAAASRRRRSGETGEGR